MKMLLLTPTQFVSLSIIIHVHTYLLLIEALIEWSIVCRLSYSCTKSIINFNFVLNLVCQAIRQP